MFKSTTNTSYPYTRCFCKAAFVTESDLRQHQKRIGHRYECICGSIMATVGDVHQHWQAKGHAKCAICHLDFFKRVWCEPEAANDGELISTSDMDRMKGKVVDVWALKREHVQLHSQTVHFFCVECTAVFNTVQKRDEHMVAENHLYCQPCDRYFQSHQGLEQHKLDSKAKVHQHEREQQAHQDGPEQQVPPSDENREDLLEIVKSVDHDLQNDLQVLTARESMESHILHQAQPPRLLNKSLVSGRRIQLEDATQRFTQMQSEWQSVKNITVFHCPGPECPATFAYAERLASHLHEHGYDVTVAKDHVRLSPKAPTKHQRKAQKEKSAKQSAAQLYPVDGLECFKNRCTAPFKDIGALILHLEESGNGLLCRQRGEVIDFCPESEEAHESHANAAVNLVYKDLCDRGDAVAQDFDYNKCYFPPEAEGNPRIAVRAATMILDHLEQSAKVQFHQRCQCTWKIPLIPKVRGYGDRLRHTSGTWPSEYRCVKVFPEEDEQA